MRNPLFLVVLITILILIDFYIYYVLKILMQGASVSTRTTVGLIYWVLCIMSLGSFLLFPYISNPYFKQYIFSIGIGWVLTQIFMVLFFLVDDLRRGAFWTMGQAASIAGAKFMNTEKGIPRSTFLSWLGVGLSSTLFLSLLYGFSNKYNYKLIKKKIALKGLPLAFKGFKIIHISDIHSGSLKDKVAVLKGIELIEKQNADLVLFTGDLVNDRASEMHDWMDVFSKIKAPYGVFSTLGNHDYGDYVKWDTVQEKRQNLEALKKVHHDLGWRLLMNENTSVEKNGEKIKIVGIENWGAKARFPKYGKMDLAMQGVSKEDIVILMSHDPSHWEAEVIPKYSNIQLTLSGHTHGMQFGLENPYFKWSPVQWVYKQWAGIYNNKDQQLYVNRGFGFLGYPGRVGILPEITLIELA
ncbi:MAG: metallophosphoesterase [Chitinophagia bacterium]|nr:metallophosphoesterase [Chitinophagia bacterium]NCA29336.1 metallophosphoesterase [Chitinophagia bacterium]